MHAEERLEKILQSVNSSFTNVVEFRHESWWQQHVYDTLSKNSIIFCSQSHPKLPDMVIHNQPVVYYRFHGVPTLYLSEYQEKQVQLVVDQIITPRLTEKAYIYFNNTMGIAGITNARQAQQMVAVRNG